MKLYYFCASCKKENSFKTSANNRYDLQKERGNEINERCSYCGTITKKRINRVHAKPNRLILLGGLIAGIIATVFLWNLGWIASLTFSIPFLAWQQADKGARNFNRVFVDDK